MISLRSSTLTLVSIIFGMHRTGAMEMVQKIIRFSKTEKLRVGNGRWEDSFLISLNITMGTEAHLRPTDLEAVSKALLKGTPCPTPAPRKRPSHQAFPAGKGQSDRSAAPYALSHTKHFQLSFIFHSTAPSEEAVSVFLNGERRCFPHCLSTTAPFLPTLGNKTISPCLQPVVVAGPS